MCTTNINVVRGCSYKNFSTQKISRSTIQLVFTIESWKCKREESVHQHGINLGYSWLLGPASTAVFLLQPCMYSLPTFKRVKYAVCYQYMQSSTSQYIFCKVHLYSYLLPSSSVVDCISWLSTQPAEVHAITENVYIENGSNGDTLYCRTSGGVVVMTSPSCSTV